MFKIYPKIIAKTTETTSTQMEVTAKHLNFKYKASKNSAEQKHSSKHQKSLIKKNFF